MAQYATIFKVSLFQTLSILSKEVGRYIFKNPEIEIADFSFQSKCVFSALLWENCVPHVHRNHTSRNSGVCSYTSIKIFVRMVYTGRGREKGKLV